MSTSFRQTYPLPQPEDLVFFSSPTHFERKVRKHFLSNLEPWSRLLGVKFLKELSQKLAVNDVSMLEDVYRQAVSILDEGIRFSAERPLFFAVIEKRTIRGGGTRELRCLHLLAKPGFRIVAHSGYIQTAYFQAKTRNDSYFTLFREGWSSMRASGLLRRIERNDLVYERLRVEWYDEATWLRCPNPHPDPRGAKRPRRLPPSVQAWLTEIDELREIDEVANDR